MYLSACTALLDMDAPEGMEEKKDPKMLDAP